MKTKLDYSLISDITFDGVDYKDYPDFCDAFINSATYMGREMTQDELEILNEDTDFVYETLIDRLH